MSFSVKCLFSVPKSCCNETTVKSIGRYIYFHGAGYGVAILTRDGGLAQFIKRTDDFARLYSLNLNVEGATYHIFGYGDGVEPRCVCPYNPCGAEFEECTDDGQCRVLCPAPRYACDDGNFAAPFFLPPYIYVDGHDTGARIYKYTLNGYVDDWQFGAYMPNASLGVLPYDDRSFYVAWSPGGYGPSDVYRCSWDVLTGRWKSTPYMKDSCKYVGNVGLYYGRGLQSMPELGGWLFGDVGTLLRPDGSTEQLNFTKRYFMGQYGLDVRAGSSEMGVVDIRTGDVVQKVELPHPVTPGASTLQTDLPYLVLTGPGEYHVCVVTYDGAAPAVQYRSSDRGVEYRVVDLLTYRPLHAAVKTWCSWVGYPQRREPLATSPYQSVVDDWRPVPRCGGVLTIEIADVYGPSDGQPSASPTADSLVVAGGERAVWWIPLLLPVLAGTTMGAAALLFYAASKRRGEKVYRTSRPPASISLPT